MAYAPNLHLMDSSARTAKMYEGPYHEFRRRCFPVKSGGPEVQSYRAEENPVLTMLIREYITGLN